MSNYIPLFYADVITYPYIASMMVQLSLLIKGASSEGLSGLTCTCKTCEQSHDATADWRWPYLVRAQLPSYRIG